MTRGGRRLKTIFAEKLIGLLLLLSAAGLANPKTTSLEAKHLTQALAQLQKSPADPTVQKLYLETFPHTYAAFLELFEPGRPLYDGEAFIDALYPLAEDHESEVGKLLTQLSKDAHYDADAPSYLQQATASFANHHTEAFLSLLAQLSVVQQHRLISFLADVENHQSYPDYQAIVDHSNALGQSALARKFEAARTERQKRHHD